jgi:hypothetical protein
VSPLFHDPDNSYLAKAPTPEAIQEIVLAKPTQPFACFFDDNLFASASSPKSISRLWLDDSPPFREAWISRFQEALRDLVPVGPALDSAWQTLEAMWRRNLKPSRIARSTDGVIVWILRSSVRASIESFESGELIASITTGNRATRVWELTADELEVALEEIYQAAVHSQTTPDVQMV